jgi:hypothetical protein
LARKHINSIYKELDHFEKTTLANYDFRRLEEYIAVLNAMEEKVLASKSSKLATAECYSLRSSIEFIRNALEKQRSCASE